MFDPRDISSDPRTSQSRPKDSPPPRRTDEQIKLDAWRETEARRTYYQSSQYHTDQRARFLERRAARKNQAQKHNGQERNGQQRNGQERNGHRREYDPTTQRQSFQDRTDRAIADVGTYRTVAYNDVVNTHFDGHPYTTRRAVDQMVRSGHVQEHTAKGPQGVNYKVLTLTESGVEQAERSARAQGLDPQQKAWSGLVKPRELSHDVAVFRAASIEQKKLLEQGAVIKRIRIDAELKRDVATATESARTRGGKEAADAARLEAAEALGLSVQNNRVEYPDAQLEYLDVEGRSGRVNVEVATEHYSAKSIAAKAAAGFAVHGSSGRAAARVARSLGQDEGGGGGGGGGRDKGSIEL